ncbi:hypothetical protein [Thomasclavelia spiroformis]|uniref:hypothetical protein n=1 Tax=Thomasclavelia spiroformis TaxID=29348 RepID=UPI00242AC9F0|nr:hypothetical protein [Thomasclavelia spiroformis]
MRYDTSIYFQKIEHGEYNSKTGDYEEDEVNNDRRMASVTGTKTEIMKLVYGSIKQGSLTIQIQNHYNNDFDYILINNKKYAVDSFRKLRTKEIFIVSEVQ